MTLFINHLGHYQVMGNDHTSLNYLNLIGLWVKNFAIPTAKTNITLLENPYH